jgi:hypothetical protein
MNMRFVVRTHLRQQRFEVFLAVLLPLFLVLESGVANAWVYAGGTFAYDLRTAIAIGRGLFFEVLTYSCFKLVRILFTQRNRQARIGLGIVGIVGLWCIIVSAGNNLGWILSGGEMGGVLASVSRYMPSWVSQCYQIGLGLLLPIAVGCIALVDVDHLVHHAIDSTIQLDTRVLQVEEAEMHRSIYLQSQRQQRAQIKQAYDEVADQRAKKMIQAVKAGDMTFGASASPQQPVLRRGTQVTPVPQQQPQLPPHSQQPALAGPAPMPSPSLASGAQTVVLPPQGQPQAASARVQGF